MTEKHHRPLDAQVIPRFAGVRTFMRLPHTTDLAGVDVAAIGIPFDTATSYRTGPRFGPEAIRSASSLIRPYNPALAVNVVDALFGGYGEGAPSGRGPEQGRIQREGNAYLKKDFPNLDYIKKATIDK